MTETFHVVKNTKVNVQEFKFNYVSFDTRCQTWIKPRNTSMVSIFCLGGGGAGGNASILSTYGGGGGGGGSSGQTSVTIAARFLPDVLYVGVGAGGVYAVASGTYARAGYDSWVGMEPSSSNDLVCYASGGNGGMHSTSATGGSGGAVGPIASIDNMPIAALGVYKFFVGLQGTSGGNGSSTPTGGTNQTFVYNGLCCMGGTGGGGGSTTTNTTGGAITAVANSFISSNRPQTVGRDGAHGFDLRSRGGPFFSYPGLGGASYGTGGLGALGGIGGNGGYGSGGGGGGTANGGGNGGNGGDGIVIITSW